MTIAFVSEVIQKEKANHDQPKDQQNMVRFHGNLLLKKYVHGRCSEENGEVVACRTKGDRTTAVKISTTNSTA